MTLRISIDKLSFGTQGDDVVQVHQALRSLGRSIPTTERATKVLGPGTVAALKALQTDLGIAETGIVDPETVAAINTRLDELPFDHHVVRGIVRDANAAPFGEGTISVSAKRGFDQVLLGSTELNGDDGSYVVSYRPLDDGSGRTDLSVVVSGADGNPLETTPKGANILINAGPLEVVNLILSGKNNPGASDFDLIRQDLDPLLFGRNLNDLEENPERQEVSLLAGQSGYAADQIADMTIASRLAGSSSLPAQVYYGLIRQGLPADLDALHATHPEVRLEALSRAVEQGAVPPAIDGKPTTEFLDDFTPFPSDHVQGLLGRILNTSEITAFTSLFVQNRDDPAAFWGRIETNSTFATRAAQLKLAVQIGGLTNNHAPLVDVVRARSDITKASDLARLTDATWRTIIQPTSIGVPPGTPGATRDQQITNYIKQIVAQVETAFPTAFFAERLGTSPVATFLKAQPTYDLQKTYPAKFFKTNPGALPPQERKLLESYQSLYRLTGNTQETLALSGKGLRSARQIARTDPALFVEQHQDVLSAERAREVHERAQRTNAAALVLLSEYGAALNQTSLHALPKLDVAQNASNAVLDAIPNWESLFGSFDFCACRECASAHGPAAHFVDLLLFLKDRKAKTAPDTVKDVLFRRRRDLGDVELSCENTNTQLPLIDLVNEILEDVVAQPLSFTPFGLASTLEADLARPIASAELANAFVPPLHPGALIEVIEAGTRWRIWDERFAFSVVKTGSALQVVGRSRQTSGSVAERRTLPQFRNSAAYDTLGQSVYPWGMPFDLPSEEANVFLAHLGVARRDLIEALRPVPDPFDPNAPVIVRMAAERLGLTDVERKIVVGEALTPPKTVDDFWGGPGLGDPAIVRAVLDRSGLGYADLDALVSTWFVNPANAVTITAVPLAPVDTCDTTKLQINGFTPAVRERMHRFVRLWRKLGWKVSELDRALRALAPMPGTPALTNAILLRLDHLVTLSSRLRLPVMQVLALWKRIDTTEPDSFYRSLFFNPAVFRGHVDFQLVADGTELINANKPLTTHAATLQAVFRLNAADFALLAGKTNGILNLGNLSFLYRHANLAQRVGLAIQDLLTAIDLTGIDPFRIEAPQDTLRFIDTVSTIRTSGFDFPRLDYLLRHRFNPAAPFVQTEANLLQILGDLRIGLLNVDTTVDAERQALRENVVIEGASAALGLSPGVAEDLLRRVTHGSVPGLQKLVELSSIAIEEPLTRGNAGAQLETLEKLFKIASVIEILAFPEGRLAWLFRVNPWLATAEPSTDPVPLGQWYPLVQLQRLRRDLKLDDAAVEALLEVIQVVAVATPDARLAAKLAFVEALSRWLEWPRENLEALIGPAGDPNGSGLLAVQFPAGYDLDLIVRLDRAMTLLKRLGVTAGQATFWCEAVVTDANARAIRAAAKAKHDDDAWHRLAPPLQNALRDKQREALVRYLVARPGEWPTSTNPADANDLLAHFLIDVEMSSCQLTSRIKQATGSVQLFAQRCLMGLEPEVETADPKWDQWKWMKNFRVWEANQKIWLYPENWIEPDLRDDKSPFFKDLENELLQSDLDDSAAEQAFLHYLEKLDQVSRLNIVGAYEDDETKTLHVFGRTFHAPHAYFYRRRAGATQVWTPWEKIELDIEGDHLIPVVWNRKLMLIWPIFTEKSEKKPVEMPATGQSMKEPGRFWEIQLAWSEYLKDGWSGKNLSKPVPLIVRKGGDVTFGDPVVRYRSTARAHHMALRIKDDWPRPPIEDDDDDGPDVIIADDDFSPGDYASVAPLHLPAKELFSFKALITDEALSLRGFLRGDYDGTPGSTELSYQFGEFTFIGCRKIVRTLHDSQIPVRAIPLAPQGTAFDRMWFSQTTPKLTMYDGKFPLLVREVNPDADPTSSLLLDYKGTLNERQNIPVLRETPSPFQLLAPHQDLHFVCDRPSFFMDQRRTFMVTSTGASGKRVRPGLPDVGGWVEGNVATTRRLSYFGPPAPPPPSLNPMPLMVLTRGRLGERVARRLSPVNINPSFMAKTAVSNFWTTRRYTFVNFHHPYVCEFIKRLGAKGIPGLLALEAQSEKDEQSFVAYAPSNHVATNHPIDEVEFQADRAYQLYNWELFFHVPLLIADRLSKNQKFEDAQRWFHFIFDPTGSSGGAAPQRYWRTKPFHDRLRSGYEAEIVESILDMREHGLPSDLLVAVEVWRTNPFSPHAVARLRTTAYQKAVVMKYIENLVAWGDHLFRRETLEALNEATQLYVLAAEILGRRPEIIQRNLTPHSETFNSFEATLAAQGEISEQAELLVNDTSDVPLPHEPSETELPTNLISYFCTPENDKLLGYWRTVADRLFKLRHCMNIEGQARQLPLFEPPIDPALLVRAQAAGLSIADVLSDLSAPPPNYRFPTMLQKANEMAAEVRNLAGALLAALEKRDAEALSTLRSDQELRLLRAVRDVRVKQVDEAEVNILALRQGREIAQARKDFFESRDFMSLIEAGSLALSTAAQIPLGTKATAAAVSVLVSLIPSAKAGSPPTIGLEFGGPQKGASSAAFGSLQDALSTILNMSSMLAGRIAEFTRRKDEWDHQANLATIELAQIDQQLIAAEIRLAIIEQELRQHDLQIDNARDTDQFLRSKFTNQDLYHWMIGRLSGIYFQSYQLAYDLARRAERCMQHELGLKDAETAIIRSGAWDSLRKGLLAGDHLAHDLKRLDVAYLDGNTREYELTKHISLLALAPDQLIALKENGNCDIVIPEWLFDLDTPGHYRRRIKMVSATLPSVTGPYTTIHCKVQMMSNSYRHSVDLTGGYERIPLTEGADFRFVDNRQVITGSIVTSTGQNDSGLFEPGMRDERYLPFEGAGVIGSWRLELPPKTLATFDYGTISDVILHFRYTAQDGGAAIRGAAITSVEAAIANATATAPLFRLVSLRHEFPSEWRRFVGSSTPEVRAMTIDLGASRFPYFVHSRTIGITATRIRLPPDAEFDVAIAPGQTAPDPLQGDWSGQAGPGPWTVAARASGPDAKPLADLFLIIEYGAS